MKKIILSLFFAGAICSNGFAVNVWDVNILNTTDGTTAIGGFLFDSNGTTKLTAGTGSDGDGAILQLGYYTSATTVNNFGTAGGTDWIALTGSGGVNSAYSNLSIGDTGGAAAGLFNVQPQFTQGSGTTGVSLPSVGQILTVRFYNTTTITGSSKYNAVSNDSWAWIAGGDPTPSLLTLSLGAANLVWLDSGNAFKTTLSAVPEPATCSLLGLGVLGMMFRRRK
jgi:hypothetical protein